MKTGITFKDDDGIEKEVEITTINAIYPYPHVSTLVYANPTSKGKKTKAYQAIKDDLKDDWSTDITYTWSDCPMKIDQINQLGKFLGL